MSEDTQTVATTPNEGEAAVNQNGPQQPRQATTMEQVTSMIKSLVVRGLIIYFIMSWLRKPPAAPTTGDNVSTTSIASRNMFADGTKMTLHIYLDEESVLTNFTPNKLFWIKDNLIYGDWSSGPNSDGLYWIEKEIPITDHIRNNGSLYLHAYITHSGQSPNPKASNFAKSQYGYLTTQLNKFKKLKNPGTKNLLTGSSEHVEVETGKIVSHWHPNYTINLVVDQTVWTYGAVPAPLNNYIKFTEDGKMYKPVLYGNDYWNMARDYKPLNETLKLRLTFQPIGFFKFQLYAAQNMKQMWNLWENNEQATDEEQDTLKETLMDTNPYLLGITMAVSILHSIFELLAFKNDIQFWNNRNSLEGLSVRSVFFGVFQALVVLLYVLDNETNTLVRISCFVGLAIEVWKIYKVVDIKFENGWIYFKDKGSYVESSTKQYDELAYKYLSWICFPLLALYCIYALIYLEHKGWYSFILNLLYGYLLTFGFIMMTPQLFINYKLKSVAHLPWRMLTYKFLNTFIDDMFAFVIKMPTMYRIGCFRDDIIFIIFLYQKWIYPVDKSRRNEFGYSEENENKNLALESSKKEGDSKEVETKKTK